MTLQDAIEATQQPDWLNPLFATLHARSKETPGKLWWHAQAMHPAIFRALRMEPKEEGSIYAAAAFRLHRSEDGPRILAAFPTPPLFDERGDDWLGIETVLAWNPVDDSVVVMGDPASKLVGAVPPEDALSIYASPFAFLRAFAEARAEWIVRRQTVAGDWHRKPAEPDLTPGLLLLTSPDKVRWPFHDMPPNITCHGVDATALNRALLRQARIPRAIAAPQDIRRAP